MTEQTKKTLKVVIGIDLIISKARQAKPREWRCSMHRGKLTRPFPLKMRHRHLLLASALATRCFSQAALAQSGRRQKGNPSAATTPVTNEPAIDSSAVKPPAPISSVIVVGDLVQSGSSHSNYVDQAVDACVKELKVRQAIEVEGSGSLKRTAAMERAKKETAAYVLWLEIKLVDRIVNDRGIRLEQSISCVNYYVFMPQTAKILAEGIVYPGRQEIRSGGAVLRLPTGNKQLPLTHQLREIGRQVANRVRDKLH